LRWRSHTRSSRGLASERLDPVHGSCHRQRSNGPGETEAATERGWTARRTRTRGASGARPASQPAKAQGPGTRTLRG